VTPLSLLVALALTLKSIFSEGYGGYPLHILLIVGGGTVALFIIGAVLLSRLKDQDAAEK
ncbi:hypothetical protein N4G37_14735, partial [Enterococcus faecalis]|nr:hypothetical protein [Enterococcus faecalis]